MRASALHRLNRPDDALRAIHAAFAHGARSTELCRLAAEICVARDELAAARAWIDRALNEDAAARDLLHLRRQIVADMHLLTGMYEHQELVVRLDPKSVDARERLIAASLRLGAYDVAEEHIDVALSQHPRRAVLHMHRAAVHMAAGRAADATTALEHALALTDSTAERVQITWLFVKAGGLAQALRTATENHALAPDMADVRLQCGTFALWQADAAAAEQWCRGLSAATRGLTRLRAAIAYVEQRHEAALALATEAVTHEPTDAEAHAVRAAALFQLGRYREADRSALTALHTTSEWLPAAQLVRAGSTPEPAEHEIMELFELLAPLWWDAGTQANPAIMSQPMRETIQAGLDRLSGNFTSALTFMPHGTHTWSSFTPRPPARIACVRGADLINIRPWDWVARRLTALAEHYPRSPLVHTYAAEVWLWSGDYAACEAECRQALAPTMKEGSRWAWIGLGAALMMQERYAEALDVFEESNRFHEPGAPLLAYRGETLRRCGQLDAAQEDLRRTLTLAPTRVSAWLNLGLIATAQGRDDEACDIFERFTARMPELVHDIQRDLRDNATQSAETIAAIFAHALFVMRGNRSSQRITYILSDGLARALATRALTSD